MKLSARQKLKLLNRAQEGEKITDLCREYNLSRFTFYKWLNRFKKKPQLTSLLDQRRRKKGSRHWNGASKKREKIVLEVVLGHPAWSSHKIAAFLKRKGLKISDHGVQGLLERAGLNRKKKRSEYQEEQKFIAPEAKIEHFLPEEKLNLILAFVEGKQKIASICRHYGLSRYTFYKWYGRYREEPQRWQERLLNRKARGEKHWRFIPQDKQKLVLDLVAAHPDYSVHRLFSLLKEKVGHHGIQNILVRNNLNSYQKRVLYSQSQVRVTLIQPVAAWFGRLKTVFETFTPQLAPAPPPVFKKLVRPFLVSFILVSSFASLFLLWLRMLAGQPFSAQIGLLFASVSLTFGFFFFIYSLKYYFTLILILGFSRQVSGGQTEGEDEGGRVLNGKGSIWQRIFGLGGNGQKHLPGVPQAQPHLEGGNGQIGVRGGLQPDLSQVKLERTPFVSIHLPMYNEKRVVDRLLSAVTSQDYENYEVIVVDDSTDETTTIVQEFAEKWNEKSSSGGLTSSRSPTEVRPPRGPVVKVIHRETREGFKGGALKESLKASDSRTEFVLVFDADFLPYPDTIVQFLKYFQVTAGGLEFRSASKHPSGVLRQLADKHHLTGEEIQATAGGLDFRNQGGNQGGLTSVGDLEEVRPLKEISDCPIAAVQGYQWHVLNKSENWVTRGVRSEYAGSYVVERSGEEALGALKQIAGSVYIIRKDILDRYGWGTSITEDFELTLRLYRDGYKVVYTPYIQTPSECVSTLKRLIRQRMRWAEGHSHNIKRMFTSLMWGRWETPGSFERTVPAVSFVQRQSSLGKETEFLRGQTSQRGKAWVSSKLTLMEKLEFLYLSPYYLQSFFFMAGTLSWFISEAVFQVKLPFWTSLWGWSLVFTNLFSLPLMNTVGLFLEESEERDYGGILSFIFLTYLLVPFQGYAAIKGFLEKEEGPWFRTPKTGRITDVFTPGRFARFISAIFGKPAVVSAEMNYELRIRNQGIENHIRNSYLSLATANNLFNNFQIPKSKHRRRFLSKSMIAGLLLVVMGLGYFSNIIAPASSAPGADFTVEASSDFPMQDVDPKLMDVPSGYPPVDNIDLDSPKGGSLSKTQIASQNTKTSFLVKDQTGNEAGVSFELDSAGAGEISKNGNKVIRKNIYSGIDLEQEIYDGYLNQIMTLANDGVNKEFSLPIVKNDNLILEDYSGHVMVKDKNTQEELALFPFPQGIDNKSKRIDYKYEIDGDRLKLYPNRSWQYEKASYPIRIYLPVNVIAWNEGTVQVGENCSNPGCAKDGDASNFRPAGWRWGTEEKRLHVQVKVPKMTAEEREKFNSKTITLEEVDAPSQKEKEWDFSSAGLARYAIDYTQLAASQELETIRNKGKKEFSPVLDAKGDKSIIKKKTNPLTSIIPDNRRMDFAMTKASYASSNKGFFATIVKKIIQPVFADGLTVKTIGSASRNFSCIQGTGCWEDSQNGDLVSAGALHGIQEGDLYADSTFHITTAQTINGSTTDASHYMYLTAPSSERHNGTAAIGVEIYLDSGNGIKCVSAQDNYTRLEWFEVNNCQGGASGTSRGIDIAAATNVLIQYVIIHDFNGGNSNGIGTSTGTGTTDDFIVRNSIIYNGGNAGIRGGGTTTVDTGLIENVTIYNMQATGADGVDDNGASFTVKNTIAMNSSSGGSDFRVTAAGSSGNYNLCSDNATDCAKNDPGKACTASPPGNCIYNKAASNQFVSITGGSEDFHLKTGADAIDAGTALTDTTDIDLETRPNGSAWDIGADEIPENLYGLILLAPFAAGLFKKLRREKK